MTDPTEKTADELKTTLADADKETADSILSQEQAREKPRVTVVKAAEDRLAELEPVLSLPEGATVLDAEPEGAWAQLLDGDGKPVLVDGQPVSAELVT